MKQLTIDDLPRAAQSHAEWLDERMPVIGGSDAAAACGMSDHNSRLALYAEKVGVARRMNNEGRSGFRPMYWGSAHEQSLRNYYRERTGHDVWNGQLCADGAVRMPQLIHPEHTFMAAHLDGLVLSNTGEVIGAVECKTASAYLKDKFGIEGTDEIPKDYLFQIQHSLEVVSQWFPQIEWMDVPVLIGGNTDMLFRVNKNRTMISEIIRLETEFMEMVDNRIEPEVDASKASTEYLSQRFPEDDGVIIAATPEIDALVYKLQQARVAVAIADDRENLLKNQIKAELKEAQGITGPDYKITWKKSKDRDAIDWEAVARAVASQGNIEDDKFKAIVAEHTETKPGSRSFRVSGKLFSLN